MRLLAVAATDSHLKWAAHLLAGAPATWDVELVVVDGATAPSRRQVETAIVGTDFEVEERTSIARLRELVRAGGHDVALLACPGPVIAAIDTLALRGSRSSPVTVAGTPGIALPARQRAVRARRGIDVFIVHSIAERRAYEAAFRADGTATRVALAHLPTLQRLVEPTRAGSVLFAPQALVPHGRDDRSRLLRALAAAADGDLMVHERTMPGEQTAHRESHPYRDIWCELVVRGAYAADNVRFVDGPMTESLAQARALVTVSSTAALEALATDVPIGIVADFGVGDDMLNSVFARSGCLVNVTADGLTNVGHPEASWRHDHYFHPDEHDDWIDQIEATVERPNRARRSAAPSTWWPAGKWLVRSTAPGASPRSATPDVSIAREEGRRASRVG